MKLGIQIFEIMHTKKPWKYFYITDNKPLKTPGQEKKKIIAILQTGNKY